jgi:hypothetical protein
VCVAISVNNWITSASSIALWAVNFDPERGDDIDLAIFNTFEDINVYKLVHVRQLIII